MTDAVVGVDIGTGAARAVAIDARGTILASASSAYPGATRWEPGRADARDWRSACLDALAAVGRSDSWSRLCAVAVGGQSPTTVAPSGAAVTIRHPAGNDLDNSARQQAQRAVLESEVGDGVEVRQLWDWMVGSLGGDDAQGRWPGDPTLDGFGARRATGEVVGTASGDRGLPPGTPLVSGAQDAYLAFWAGGIDVPGRAMDPGGRTGGLAVAVASGFDAGDLWTFASAASGVEVAGGPVNAHGIAVEWIADLVGRPIEDLVAAAAGVPAGSRGVLFLPYLEGERAPRWDADLRGLVAGLDAHVTAAELARAVLEGTACGLAHLARRLRDAGAAIDTLVCAGRPARSHLWSGIKAAVLGVEALVPDDPDLAAYGAALAAGAGAGWWPRPGEGEPGSWPRPRMRRLAPLVAASGYSKLVERFISVGDLVQRHPVLFGGEAAGHVNTTES